MQLKNDRYLRALRKQPVDKTPVWIMRQAGRYLPEYRQTRAKAGDFLTLCKTPELACEVTMQPLRRFQLDAAILFSDILTIPDAMGLGLSLHEGVGPKFDKPITSHQEIVALPSKEVVNELGYVFDAVSLIHKTLDGAVPLIGFTGSPWTLATYMVEGGGSKDFSKVKGMMYAQPKSMHLLLEKVAQTVSEYLVQQARSGAQSLMVFDTWGGVLSGDCYREFSLQYMQQIVQSVKSAFPQLPITLFTKGAGLWLEDIANTGCDAVGLDWSVPLAEAQQRIGHKVALQGNLDPAVLYADADTIRQHAKNLLEQFKADSGHVFNLGHGIQPAVDPDKLKVLIDFVHEYSASLKIPSAS